VPTSTSHSSVSADIADGDIITRILLALLSLSPTSSLKL
jgi:hypothetical protein